MGLNSRILKDSFVVTAIGGASQLMGFLVTLFLARYFGVGETSDAYFVAFILPTTAIAVVAGVIKVVFVPLVIEHRLKNPDRIEATVSAALGGIVWLCAAGIVIVVPVVWLAAPLTAHIGAGSALVSSLTLELLPLIPLTLAARLLGSTYNAYQRFGLNELAGVLHYAIVLIVLCFGVGVFGIHSLVLGHIAGRIAALTVTWALVRYGLGLRVRPEFRVTAPAFELFRLSVVPLAAYGIAQLSPMISRIVAALLDVGSVSYFAYAERIAAMPAMLVGSGFGGVVLSHWALAEGRGKSRILEDSVNRAISFLLFVLVPLTILLCVLRVPLIKFLLGRGEFDVAAISGTATVLFVLAFVAIPTYVHSLVVRVLLLHRDYRKLLWLSIVGVAIHLLLSVVLASYCRMGVVGVALSVVLSTSIVLLATLVYIDRQYVTIRVAEITVRALQIGGAGLFMVLVTKLVMDWLGVGGQELSPISVLGAGGFAGASTYVGLLAVMRFPELMSLGRYVKKLS